MKSQRITSESRLYFGRAEAWRERSLSQPRGRSAGLAPVSALVALVWFQLVALAAAEDLSARDTGWNGLSGLVELARAAGLRVETPARVDLSTLGPKDALLIVHPTQSLPAGALAELAKRGARIAVADDFGSGGELFEAFGITRALPRDTRGHRGDPNTDNDNAELLRGNRNLRIAEPESDHPLTRNVSALVTNHPAVLRHPSLTPVFALVEGHMDTRHAERDAVVLSGAVGEGRLVAISDCSVLINNMLELQGNRAFAENLVRYLASAPGSTLHIVDSAALVSASSAAFGAGHPLHGVASALARMAELPLPPLAVAAISVVLALLLVFAAATALPKRSAYARRFFLPAPECSAGYAGRISHHARKSKSFLLPTLAFKLELETRLISKLRLRGQPLLKDVVAGLQRAGITDTAAAEARALLIELDDLYTRSQGIAPEVPRRKFSELVATGRRILALL